MSAAINSTVSLLQSLIVVSGAIRLTDCIGCFVYKSDLQNWFGVATWEWKYFQASVM